MPQQQSTGIKQIREKIPVGFGFYAKARIEVRAQQCLPAITHGQRPPLVVIVVDPAINPIDPDVAFEFGLGLIVSGLNNR
ncbi:MAG: hypothetical protein ABI171_20510 [Collimonas sp.]|uniref:hypothetical protein n=1 Tax=Collimonas sp. TaxID=1963772 RepID=UPI00326330C3